MKIKFLSTVLATAATVALVGCNSNDDSQGLVKEPAQINLSVKLPTPATRGFIDDAVSKDAAVTIKAINAKLMRKGMPIATKDVFELNEATKTYKIDFGQQVVNGQEKIRVVLNGGANGTTNVPVADIQPIDGAAGIANAMYIATSSELSNHKKDGIYNVKAEATSLAARLEIKDAPKFNERWVKSMDLVFVSPVNYSKIYGESELQKTVKDAALRYPSVEFDKLADAKTELEALKNLNGKVVANHLFDGDETKVVVGFKMVKYVPATDDLGAYLIYEDKEKDKSYYIYEVAKGEFAADLSADYRLNLNEKWVPEFHKVTITTAADGKVTISKPEEALNVEVKDLISTENDEYFTISDLRTEGTSDIFKTYKGGNIYKLSLNKNLKWNTNRPGFEDVYTPDVNTGVETPDTTDEVVIKAEVTVAPWAEKNVDASIK